MARHFESTIKCRTTPALLWKKVLNMQPADMRVADRGEVGQIDDALRRFGKRMPAFHRCMLLPNACRFREEHDLGKAPIHRAQTAQR